MQTTTQMKSRSRRALLMAEFNVQVFSNGRVDWGELGRFIRTPELDARRLVARLMSRARPD
jgi:hypothetical protein